MVECRWGAQMYWRGRARCLERLDGDTPVLPVSPYSSFSDPHPYLPIAAPGDADPPLADWRLHPEIPLDLREGRRAVRECRQQQPAASLCPNRGIAWGIRYPRAVDMRRLPIVAHTCTSIHRFAARCCAESEHEAATLRLANVSDAFPMRRAARLAPSMTPPSSALLRLPRSAQE